MNKHKINTCISKYIFSLFMQPIPCLHQYTNTELLEGLSRIGAGSFPLGTAPGQEDVKLVVAESFSCCLQLGIWMQHKAYTCFKMLKGKLNIYTSNYLHTYIHTNRIFVHFTHTAFILWCFRQALLNSKCLNTSSDLNIVTSCLYKEPLC